MKVPFLINGILWKGPKRVPIFTWIQVFINIFFLHFIGVRDTLCDVRDLRPGYDYKFRIRVENKHGVSEPSPYTTAHRSKIYEPPKPEDFLPKPYEIEHPPLQKYGKFQVM